VDPRSFEIWVKSADCAHRASLRLILDRCSTLLQLFELVASSDGQLVDRLLLPPLTQVTVCDVIVTLIADNVTNYVINKRHIVGNMPFTRIGKIAPKKANIPTLWRPYAVSQL
jgi:hypothetical protein